MAEIKKIKVDGVEYDIGSNLGAELEWKLVASGAIVKEDKYKVKIENITIELKKQYILRIFNGPYGVFDVFNLCFIKEGDCNYRNAIDENEEPTLVSYYYEEYIKELQLLSDGNGVIYGSGDEYELYELTIKNVENPVVTPNKLKLYTTGTLDEEIQVGDTEIYYKLEKPLQPNKLYYVERYDANMGVYYNCIIKTDYDALLKCTTKMLASEDDCDTTIFAGIAIIQFGEDDIPNLFYINGGEYSIYKDPEDTLEIYELPFEF